jgi:hypothetical protein
MNKALGALRPMWTRVLTMATSVVLSGCATMVTDHTGFEDTACPVHNVPMEVRVLPCTPYFMGYLPEYDHVVRTQFPYYEATRHGCEVARRVRTHTCPECSRAYHEWHRTHDLFGGRK